jgi:hypothetical protein
LKQNKKRKKNKMKKKLIFLIATLSLLVTFGFVIAQENQTTCTEWEIENNLCSNTGSSNPPPQCLDGAHTEVRGSCIIGGEVEGTSLEVRDCINGRWVTSWYCF